MVNLTADEGKRFSSKSSGNELRGAASYFIIVAAVHKWGGVEKLINKRVTGSDFLAFRHELPYNDVSLCENEAKYIAFQPISA
jgi:hypothetical protein